ncbi:hypothetical protein IIC65_04525, partial [Candidatus Sumerlaeota bacterium]|nr:hypothetical protein [Candidatus Sumerlaeota bacterium]
NVLSFVPAGARFVLDDTQALISVLADDAAFVQIAPENTMVVDLTVDDDDPNNTIPNPLRFSPVDRDNDSLYRMRVLITSESTGSASEGTLDAVDAIQMAWLAPTTEQGQADFSIRAVPGTDPALAIMNQAASPHPGVTNEYQSYFFTNTVTLNTGPILGLRRIKPFVQFFNTAGFGVDLSVVGLDGGPSGGDAFVIESFIVEKLQTP